MRRELQWYEVHEHHFTNHFVIFCKYCYVQRSVISLDSFKSLWKALLVLLNIEG